jgi:hypothetical protein
MSRAQVTCPRKQRRSARTGQASSVSCALRFARPGMQPASRARLGAETQAQGRPHPLRGTLPRRTRLLGDAGVAARRTHSSQRPVPDAWRPLHGTAHGTRQGARPRSGTTLRAGCMRNMACMCRRRTCPVHLSKQPRSAATSPKRSCAITSAPSCRRCWRRCPNCALARNGTEAEAHTEMTGLLCALSWRRSATLSRSPSGTQE